MQLPGNRSWIYRLEVDILPLLNWGQILVRESKSTYSLRGKEILGYAAVVAIIEGLGTGN